MKQWIIAFILAGLVFSSVLAEESVKYDALPPIFEISVETVTEELNDNEAFISKEYLKTVNEDVNKELAALVDSYELEMAAYLQPNAKKKGHQNNWLNVNVIYYRSGDRWVSTMIEAEVVFFREQQALEMTTGTYDLISGKRLMLQDIFPEDSQAWDLLAQGVRQHMNTIYPEQARDKQKIEALCERGALAQADFTLSGMELTLHYFNSEIFAGKPHLTHVRFYYPQFEGMMTELGVAATDNSRWKMVAITCDDGPKDFNSTYALNAFRKQGARVTYFVVGTQLERYGDVFQRQMNQNHTFGNHTYHHWSGYSFKRIANRRLELTKNDDLTLALIGEAAPYFRAPGGTYPPWMEAELTVPIIQWTLDTYDYTGKEARKIFYSIRNNVEEYDIILCHDTGKYLHQAVPIFGEYLTSNGYMMVTLQELEAAQGVQADPNVVYFSFRPDENRDAKTVLKKKK